MGQKRKIKEKEKNNSKKDGSFFKLLFHMYSNTERSHRKLPISYNKQKHSQNKVQHVKYNFDMVY